MGYGGIIKTVFRVAASVVGGMVCGPPCAAIGSAVATGATGGSFKESLMAGATSYIGASISQGLSGAIGDTASTAANEGALAAREAALQAVPLARGVAVGAADVARTAGIEAARQAAIDGVAGGLGQTAIDLVDPNAPVNQGITEFGDTLNETFGSVNGVNVSAFDRFANSAQESLVDLGFDTSSVAPMAIGNAGDLVGVAAGGLSEITLNQALLDADGAYDDILGQVYSPQQIQLLKREARNALSQTAYDDLLASTTNPGLADDEFGKIIASGVERENTALGENITREQFDNRFSTPDLGQTILNDETNLRKQNFNSQLDNTFTGKAFDSIDDEIIDSIVQERSGPARQQVSNYEARGNLNATGGQNANQFLTEQEESAKTRVRQEADSVLGGTQQQINSVRDNARTGIDSYKLGDDLFDVTPFSEQRNTLVNEQQGRLGDDIRGSLGSTPLFDINKALQAGGKTQGVVSGTGTNQSFLDSIAAREGAISSSKDQRGVGSRGSGAF